MPGENSGATLSDTASVQLRMSALDPERLAEERPRLIRYCARVTGDSEMAEDLAQETLLTAWKNRHTLRDTSVWQAWLTGIARNLCARHVRSASVERRRRLPQDDSLTPLPSALEKVPDTALPEPEAYLERKELLSLLDRALGVLPRSTHELLLARYRDDLPLAEIAARRGVPENTAAVHLHRSRQALRQALVSPELRAESAALGLLTSAEDQSGCVETRIWCPRCGKRRMVGKLEVRRHPLPPSQIKALQESCPILSQGPLRPEKAIQPPEEEATEFLLACPDCDTRDDFLLFMRIFRSSPTGDLLDGIKGIKPALNRVSIWWGEVAHLATETRKIPCPRCGACSPVRTVIPRDYISGKVHGLRRDELALLARCPRCSFALQMGVMDISLNIEAGRNFWRSHPRLVALPSKEIASTDGPLVVSRLESQDSRAALEVVYRADTLQIIRTVGG